MSGVSPPLAEQPVTTLRGVGPERALLLERLGIRTLEDLLLHPPHRHEDRRQPRPIGALALGETAMVHGHIVTQGVSRWQRGRKSVFTFVLEDGTGRLHCRWWNQPYLDQQFAVGNEVLVFGRVKQLKPTTMDHPETEIVEGGEEQAIHVGRVVPIYPLTEGISQRWLRSLIWHALPATLPAVSEPWPPELTPDHPAHAVALRWLHAPADLAQGEAARRRLAFEEFVRLQQGFWARRQRFAARARAFPCPGTNHLIKPFLRTLGFSLTPAQTRVLRDIRHDLAAQTPMRRLLQGDVGCGKTVVAACAALMTLESGHSVALMAPTEILAAQHALSFARWLRPLGVPVQLRTAQHKTADPAPPHPAAPPPTLTLGTHALLEDTYAPRNLGLVMIDEQHKFGVAQRETLVRKGRFPHLLVMTATPIPRTLGLTLYGDLDVSVIDAVPAGRGRVRTFVRTEAKLEPVWTFVRQKLAEGRQAYVVYPRVEEAEPTGSLKAVVAEYAHLKDKFAPYPVGWVHGRLRAEEKDAVMEAFRTGKVALLIATSVIEVGVDVPNATVMVIQNAESYGLAQLHQLRGRIGRGTADSTCILIAAAKTPAARQRLRILEDNTDGFAIAEADLRLRGPGELLGQTQSGMPQFRFGDLLRDLDLLEAARAFVRNPGFPTPPLAD